NYYLYEQNGVFLIIPWDYNMSFGGFGVGGGGGRMGGENSQNSADAPTTLEEPGAQNNGQLDHISGGRLQ
ncbi:CotH kinase family protein, partial [Bacillus cereus]|uniref:CotH kinase family protein n=1 Tax=Bacillus cereus TaxID=1396 RepID=UPI0020BDC91E